MNDPCVSGWYTTLLSNKKSESNNWLLIMNQLLAWVSVSLFKHYQKINSMKKSGQEFLPRHQNSSPKMLKTRTPMYINNTSHLPFNWIPINSDFPLVGGAFGLTTRGKKDGGSTILILAIRLVIAPKRTSDTIALRIVNPATVLELKNTLDRSFLQLKKLTNPTWKAVSSGISAQYPNT